LTIAEVGELSYHIFSRKSSEKPQFSQKMHEMDGLTQEYMSYRIGEDCSFTMRTSIDIIPLSGHQLM